MRVCKVAFEYPSGDSHCFSDQSILQCEKNDPTNVVISYILNVCIYVPFFDGNWACSHASPRSRRAYVSSYVASSQYLAIVPRGTIVDPETATNDNFSHSQLSLSPI